MGPQNLPRFDRGHARLFLRTVMSTSPTLATEQLLELLMQLKKTTPDAARQILNAQPQIAYALITLMVSMNAIDIDVFQRTLTSLGPSGTGAPGPAAAPVPPVASAIPPYVQPQTDYRTPTPPTSYPPQPPSYANGQGRYAASSSYPPAHTPTPTQAYGGGYGGYQQSAPPQAPPSNPATASVANMLASIPDDQKALVVQLLSLTPEQIAALPPAERTNVIQLRTTLGLPM
ncbi:hypothetical protein EV715DRAFT_252739 [Schizophyllum commune]